MTDLSKTIAPKSDQLNADDLIAGPRTITVTRVAGNESAEQPVSIFFEGDNGKPYKPGLSMRRVLVQVWGAEGDEYIGRRMTLYQDPEVKFGGIKVGGIRISHMSHIPKDISLMLTRTRGKKGEFRVSPLGDDPSKDALVKAEEEAAKGKDAFTAFWNSEYGKQNRNNLKPYLSDLQAIAERAEEASEPLSQRLRKDEAHPTETDAPTHDPSTVFPGDDAYTEGVQAAQAAMREDMNPHEPGSDAWNNWIGGYRFHAANAEKVGGEE